MLTRRQHLLLTYLRERARQSGAAPSFSEMAEALGLRSKAGVHRLITALEERGHIRRLAHRARAIEVIDASGDAGATLIAEVLSGGVADLVEQVHPGWSGRARAFLDIKHVALCLTVLGLLAAPASAHDGMPSETRSNAPRVDWADAATAIGGIP